ncbi:MAG: YdcF family protein [Deltaproteobacteria bacterium]|nr:YdcF family protein [Deltaproteobacteria bacterium]
MFLVKKAIASFVLPPGIFVAALLVSALWFFWRKSWKAAMVNAVLGLVMWAAAIAPVGDKFLHVLESGYPPYRDAGADVIILLGGGIYSGVPDLSGTGAPSEDALARVVTTCRLYKRLDVPVIVCGGQVFERAGAEAPILKRFLVDLGVPSGRIILEQESRDTHENAIYARRIVERFGFKKPLLVTSGYHMKRAVLAFEKVGLDVAPAPANIKTWPDRRYLWTNYLPGTFEAVAVALKEYLGIVFYTLFY